MAGHNLLALEYLRLSAWNRVSIDLGNVGPVVGDVDDKRVGGAGPATKLECLVPSQELSHRSGLYDEIEPR